MHIRAAAGGPELDLAPSSEDGSGRRTWKPPGRACAAAAAEAHREHLSAAFSRHLHVSAKPFVPNVHAAEFVPSFLRGPAEPSPPPAGAGANHHGAGSGAGGPSERRILCWALEVTPQDELIVVLESRKSRKWGDRNVPRRIMGTQRRNQ
ncbi:Eukaryotic peptide chain release factor GTP-binding subunit ERF3B [Manis javanica]|nr:Eukaryotic peptide chain release factor GTP-binding subunit ERF3B [Manis javanica]